MARNRGGARRSLAARIMHGRVSVCMSYVLQRRVRGGGRYYRCLQTNTCARVSSAEICWLPQHNTIKARVRQCDGIDVICSGRIFQ